MISRTKYQASDQDIRGLFEVAGIDGVEAIAPLGAGEYNAVFCAKAKGKEYVLKIAPPEEIPVLTYEHNMMNTEVFWYRQLQEHTSIRVPEIYYSDFENKQIPTAYFIMEKLQGCQLDQMKFQDSEKDCAAIQLAQMAAQIHKIKNDRFGYIQNELYDDWYQAIRAMTQALVADCGKKGKKTKRGQKLLQFIDRYRAVLEPVECTMVNFDLWPANILCERVNGQVEFAWIDPERSLWGDRILDFACLESMTPLEQKKVTLSAYNAVSDRPVQVTQDEKIRFAVAQGYLGLVMETEKYYRYTPFHFGWWRNVSVSKWYFANSFKTLSHGE